MHTYYRAVNDRFKRSPEPEKPLNWVDWSPCIPADMPCLFFLLSSWLIPTPRFCLATFSSYLASPSASVALLALLHDEHGLLARILNMALPTVLGHICASVSQGRHISAQQKEKVTDHMIHWSS